MPPIGSYQFLDAADGSIEGEGGCSNQISPFEDVEASVNSVSFKADYEVSELPLSSLESIKSGRARKLIRAAVRASKQVPVNSDPVRDAALIRLQKRLSRIGGKSRLVADFPDGPSVCMTLTGRIVSISDD